MYTNKIRNSVANMIKQAKKSSYVKLILERTRIKLNLCENTWESFSLET